MVSCLGSLVQLRCREGGALQTDVTGVCGEHAQCSSHTGFVPAHGMCFPRLHCSGSRLPYREQALSCMHFPGLRRSGSGSRVLHKSAGSIGPAFCPSPTRAAQAARSLTGSFSLGAARLIPSVVPASVSAHQSGAPCVCSGELASSYDPPSGCQPSRISGSVWLETGSLFAAG